METRSTKRLAAIGLRDADSNLISTAPSAEERSLISRLPDECLIHTFRFLPGFTHGLVSIHWLRLAREALQVLPVTAGRRVKKRFLLPRLRSLLSLYPNLQKLEIDFRAVGLFGDEKLVSIIASCCPHLQSLSVEKSFDDYMSLQCVTKLVQAWPQLRVLGIPLHLDGSNTPACLGELKYVDDLHLKLICLHPSFTTTGAMNGMIGDTVGRLQSLKKLHLTYLGFQALPPSLGTWHRLEDLTIIGDSLESLPDSFGNLVNLKCLYLCGKLQSLPPTFARLTRLEELDIAGADLQSLPSDLDRLTALSRLSVMGLPLLETLPANLGELKMLRQLNVIRATSLSALPESVGDLSSLTILRIYDCPLLEQFPDSFTKLHSLTSFGLSACRSLRELPSGFGALQSLWSLRIEDCASLHLLPSSLLQLASLRRLTLKQLPSVEKLREFGKNFKKAVRVTIVE